MLSLRQSIFSFILGLVIILSSSFLLSSLKQWEGTQFYYLIYGLIVGISGMSLGLGKIIFWILNKMAKSDDRKKILQEMEIDINRKNDVEGFIFVKKVKNWLKQYVIYYYILILTIAPIYFLLFLWILATINIQSKTLEVIILFLLLAKISMVFYYVARDLIIKNKNIYKKENEYEQTINDHENLSNNLVSIIKYLTTTTNYTHHSLKNAAVIIDGILKNIEAGDVITKEDREQMTAGIANLWRAIEDFNTFGKQKGEIDYPLEVLINAIHLLHKVRTKKLDFQIIYDKTINPKVLLHVEWHDAYQMIDNLLGNAYEAVESSTTKKVYLLINKHSEQTVSITVADTGVGIPKFYHDKLFQVSFTTKDATTIKRGTGLTHIKHLVSKAGGEVKYKPQTDGFSTIFELLLPIIP